MYVSVLHWYTVYAGNVIIRTYYMNGLFKKSLLYIFHDDRVATVGTRRDNIHRIPARNVTNPYIFMRLYLYTYLYRKHNSVLIEYSNVHDPYTLTG